MSKQLKNYSAAYSAEGFWNKVKQAARSAGEEIIEPGLKLYYTLLDGDTPGWAKGVISSSLGYFILPLDAIPDVMPVVGYSDDLAMLALAVSAVAAHIKEAHSTRAKETLQQWFG